MENELTPALMSEPKQVLVLVFAGNATLTFRSIQTGTRYTYKVRESELSPEQIARGDKPVYFVSLLTGADNENDFTYIGILAQDRYKNNALGFRTTAKTKNPSSQPVKAFAWAIDILLQGRIPQGLEIWHEGRCARCGRKLTDPASISSGFGPECIKHGTGLGSMLTPAPAPTPVAPKPVVDTKPRTPAAILAAVDADPEIKRLTAELAARKPVVITPAPMAPLPVDSTAAAALAKSQGWDVDYATTALGRRKVVTSTPKKAAKVAGDETTYYNGEVTAKVHELRDSDIESYTMDGIMTDKEAFDFWYRKFCNDATTVGV